MRKFILAIPVSLLTLLLTSCGESHLNIEFYTLYETPDEIYYELNILDPDTYNTGNVGEYENYYAYNLAVFNKSTEELSIIDDRDPIDYKNIVNYTGSSSKKETRYSIEHVRDTRTGHRNNPVFYNRDNEEYFNIVTNEVVELSKECTDIRYNNYTCNILEGDIEVVLDKNEDNSFELSIANYITNTNFTSYSFTGDNISSEQYTLITTYDNYDDNKIGIRINYYNLKPGNSNYTDEDHIETIILEYSYDTNSIEELYRDTLYQDYTFNAPTSCYTVKYEWVNDDNFIQSLFNIGTGHEQFTLYDLYDDEAVMVIDKYNEDLIKKVKYIYDN